VLSGKKGRCCIVDKQFDEAILKDLPTVTKEQALAFLDALVGWEDIADQQARPKSPHALTHIEAVLGRGNTLGADLAQYASKNPESHKTERQRLRTLSRYLLAAVLVLSEVIPDA
jgi:hypothetical protein